jgi:sugar lactone lactonase YvrE
MTGCWGINGDLIPPAEGELLLQEPAFRVWQQEVMSHAGARCRRPRGALRGRIRIPEIVANISFGGPKRNRLFIAASQSLYALYTATQGAAPG